MAFDTEGQDEQNLNRQAVLGYALDSIRELFASKGVHFDDEEVEQLVRGNIPPTPSFPFLMFTAAFIKDAIDVLDLTIIGVVVAFFFSVFFSFILVFWSMGKISGGWWKKGMIRWILKRAGICVVIEFIPFVQIIPATTIFILLAHYHESKVAKLFNKGLEQLHNAGWRG